MNCKGINIFIDDKGNEIGIEGKWFAFCCSDISRQRISPVLRADRDKTYLMNLPDMEYQRCTPQQKELVKKITELVIKKARNFENQLYGVRVHLNDTEISEMV